MPQATKLTLLRHRLLVHTEPGALPFAVVVGDAVLSGYASHKWVVDLLVWAQDAPWVQRDRILGLLLGYSGEAIRDFEELGSTVGRFDQEVFDGSVRRDQSMPEVRQQGTSGL